MGLAGWLLRAGYGCPASVPFPCDGPLAISPAVRRTLVVIEAALIFLDDARRFEEAQGERHATAPLPDRIGPYQGSGSGVSTAKGFASGYEYIVSLKYNVTIMFSAMLMACPVYHVIQHWF